MKTDFSMLFMQDKTFSVADMGKGTVTRMLHIAIPQHCTEQTATVKQ